jgi:hypothetical protein
MNPVPIENAFDYSTPIVIQRADQQKYSHTCIYCSNPESVSLMNDGGSFRRCIRCKKNFMCRIHETTRSVVNSNK